MPQQSLVARLAPLLSAVASPLLFLGGLASFDAALFLFDVKAGLAGVGAACFAAEYVWKSRQ